MHCATLTCSTRRACNLTLRIQSGMPRGGLPSTPRSFREGGWRRAIVVSKRSGLIVFGQGAWLAAVQELKVDVVPVDRQDFATEEAEE